MSKLKFWRHANMDPEMESQLVPLFTWLKTAAEEERADDEEPFRCAWTCVKCWIKLLQKIEPDADDVPALSEDNLGAIVSYVAERASVFYQCKASNCLDYARVVQGDRHGLAEATVLLLYWAVQCRPNEHFIELIQALDEDMQLSIMGTIKKAAEQIDDQGALLHGNISIFSPGTVGKGSPKNGIPSDCSPVLSTPKRPAHSTVLATPSTRSRMYYSGFNSPAAIRWLCSPAMCPATRVGNRKRTSNPALSEQVTHNPEDEKERQVAQLRKHVQTLEESLRSQTTLLEASEADYQALSKEMAKLRYENEVLAGEVSQVQAYKDRIDEMDSMTLHAAHLEKTNARLEQALSRQSEKKAEEVKQLEEESARRQDSIQELQKALEEKKNTVVAVQVELQAALRRAARQEALAEAAEGQLDKLKEENNKLRSEEFSVSCQVSEMKQQLAEWEAKCDRLSQDNLLLEERKGELLRQTEQLQCQVEAVRTAGEVHTQEALEAMRAELQALQESVLAEERATSEQLLEATRKANQKELLMERVSFQQLMEKEREEHAAAMEEAKKAYEVKLKETEGAVQNILKEERVAHKSALERERISGQLQLEEAKSTHQLEMRCERESLQHVLEEESEAHAAAMALEGKVLEMKLHAVKAALQEVIDEEQDSHTTALEESNVTSQGLLAKAQSELEAERVSFQQLLAREREGHTAAQAEAKVSHEAAMEEARATLLMACEEEKAMLQNALEEANTHISVLCRQMEEERMTYISRQQELEKEQGVYQEQLRSEQKVQQEMLDRARGSHLQELESLQDAHQKDLEQVRAVYQRWMEEQKDALRDELLAAHQWELEEERRSHQMQLDNTTNSLQAQLRVAMAELGEERVAHALAREKVRVAHQLSCGEGRSAEGRDGMRQANCPWSGRESQHSTRGGEHRKEVTDENIKCFGATSAIPSSSVSMPPPSFPRQKPPASKERTTHQPHKTSHLYDPNRLSELQRRNSIVPPHLRSSYPVETQTKPESPHSSDQAIRLGTAPLLTTTTTLLQQDKEYPCQHTKRIPSDLMEESSRERDDDRRMSLAFNLEAGPSEKQIPERLRKRMEASKLQREERQHARLEAAQKLKQQQEAAKKSKVKRKPLASTNAARIK